MDRGEPPASMWAGRDGGGALSRRPSSPPSRASTSSTGHCAPCSTTTCRPRVTRAAPSRRVASWPPSCSTRSTTTSADPDRDDADILSFAAGHKAMGLYAMWALRDEIARLAAPELLPDDPRHRLRLEDLLGFRRNPTTATPLFAAQHAKALDGHPTPATPFVRLATGASGVGLASSIGLAIGARDRFGADCPRVHISEGEGGLTPGRVAEALAAAGTASLGNVVVHLDWNQASIDSDRVCRDGGRAGRLRAVAARRAVLLARLERRAGGRRPRLPAGGGRPAPGAVARQRSADGGRLPHAEGLEVRCRGSRLARRRPQAVLRGLLSGARRAHRRRRGRAADLRARRPALRRSAGRRGARGMLLGGAADRAPPARPTTRR